MSMAGKVSGFGAFVSLCGNRKMHFRKDFFRFLTETAAFLTSLYCEGTLFPPPGGMAKNEHFSDSSPVGRVCHPWRSAMAGKVSGFVVFVSLCGNRKIFKEKPGSFLEFGQFILYLLKSQTCQLALRPDPGAWQTMKAASSAYWPTLSSFKCQDSRYDPAIHLLCRESPS